VGQRDQTVRQQLQRPAFAPIGWLALGQAGQNSFDLIIDFGPAACPGAFVQGKVQAARHKLAPRSNDRISTGVQYVYDFLIFFALVG